MTKPRTHLITTQLSYVPEFELVTTCTCGAVWRHVTTDANGDSVLLEYALAGPFEHVFRMNQPKKK